MFVLAEGAAPVVRPRIGRRRVLPALAGDRAARAGCRDPARRRPAGQGPARQARPPARHRAAGAVVRDQPGHVRHAARAQLATTARSASTSTPGSRRAASRSASTCSTTRLSALFLLLITGVGSLIHIYSIGYMEHDPRRTRFFGYLNLFVAAMLTLVLAANYLGALPRLGGRRPRVVPADRLLAVQALRGGRGQEGLHRQPGRRHRTLAGHRAVLRTFGTTDFTTISRPTPPTPPRPR